MQEMLGFMNTDNVAAAPLATSFASTLAWVILKLGESGPIAPWRLLFLIEGFPSMLVAAIAWHVIPDTPESAPYLTPRERKVARLRLRRDRPRPRKRENESSIDAQGRGPSGLRSREVLAVLADPVAWLTAIIFFLTNMAYSSLPVFLPTILTAMGHSALSAQALSAPPYLLSFVVVLATASLSDRMQSRAPFVTFHALSSAVGYGILAFARVPAGSWLRYAAVYPAAVGFFNVVVLTIAWSVNNQRGESRQGGGFALLQFVGQCGPLVGTRLYPDRDAPFFREGMVVCAGAMLGVAVLAGVLRWWLGRLNLQLEREEARKVAEDEESDAEELAGSAQRRRPPDEAPFRYIM
jgi:cyanate permease